MYKSWKFTRWQEALFLGTVPWHCSLALFLGTVPWHCSLALFLGTMCLFILAGRNNYQPLLSQPALWFFQHNISLVRMNFCRVPSKSYVDPAASTFSFLDLFYRCFRGRRSPRCSGWLRLGSLPTSLVGNCIALQSRSSRVQSWSSASIFISVAVMKHELKTDIPRLVSVVHVQMISVIYIIVRGVQRVS